MSPSPPPSAIRPFGGLPVLRHGGGWLLAAGSATARADGALAVELDAFAEAIAAADRTVAALHARARRRR